MAQRSSGGYDVDRDPADDQMAKDSSFVHHSPGKGSFIEPYYPEPEVNGYGSSDFAFEYDDDDDCDYLPNEDSNAISPPTRNGSSPEQLPPLESQPTPSSRRGPGLCYILSLVLLALFGVLLAASFNPTSRDFVRHNISAPVADTMEKVPNLLHFTFPVVVIPASPPAPQQTQDPPPAPIVNNVLTLEGSAAETLMIEIDQLAGRLSAAKKSIGQNTEKADKGAKDVDSLVERLKALEKKIETKAEDGTLKELKLAVDQTSEKVQQSLREHEPVIEATAKDAAKVAVKEWAASNSGVAIQEAKTAAKQVVDEALKDLPSTINGLADLEELKALRKEFEALAGQVKLGEDGVIEKVLQKLEKSPVFRDLEDAVTTTQHTIAKLGDRVPSHAKDIAQLHADLTKARADLTSLKGDQTSSDEKARTARAAQQGLEKEIKELQKSVTKIDEVSQDMLALTTEFGALKHVVEHTNASNLALLSNANVERTNLDEKIQGVNAALLETKRDIMQELSKVAKEARTHQASSGGGGVFSGSNLQPQVEAIIERYYYGERDEEVDWASNALGGTVKDTSKQFTRFGDFVTRTDVESILSPMTSPTDCFQLDGNSGWILFTTPRGISPQKFVVEYPMGIYPSKNTFGREFALYGSSTEVAGAAKGDLDKFVKLHEGALEVSQAGGHFSIELDPSRAQAMNLHIREAPAGTSDTDGIKLEGPIYNIFKMVLLSNHGAEDMTCLFRIRLYGQGFTGMAWREFRDNASF